MHARSVFFLDAGGEFPAHFLERTHAPFIACPTCLDALTNPDFFLPQLLVEAGIRDGFVFQRFFLAAQEIVVVPGPAT